MNVRDFREEIAEAFIKGVEWSVQACPSEQEIARRGGVDSIIMAEAQKYAGRRVLENASKLDPMP